VDESAVSDHLSPEVAATVYADVVDRPRPSTDRAALAGARELEHRQAVDNGAG